MRIDRPYPPAQWQEWLDGTPSGVREYELYLIRHGQVFFDPLGEFSARRSALAQYPRLARLQRVSDELFNVWHFGQYNFLDRRLIRQDPLALQIKVIIRPTGSGSPSPSANAGALPRSVSLGRLSESGDLKERGKLVREMCAAIHEMLKAAGLASRA